jgi:hypothetical protein
MMGYFLSSNDMHMLEDAVHSLPTSHDTEDALEEILSILDSKTPIVVMFPEKEDGV